MNTRGIPRLRVTPHPTPHRTPFDARLAGVALSLGTPSETKLWLIPPFWYSPCGPPRVYSTPVPDPRWPRVTDPHYEQRRAPPGCRAARSALTSEDGESRQWVPLGGWLHQPPPPDQRNLEGHSVSNKKVRAMRGFCHRSTTAHTWRAFICGVAHKETLSTILHLIQTSR